MAINFLLDSGGLEEALTVVESCKIGLQTVHTNDEPNIESLGARLYEAKVLAYKGEHQKAIQISNEVKPAMLALNLHQESPSYLIMSKVFGDISLGVGDYSEQAAEFDKEKNTLIDKLAELMKEQSSMKRLAHNNAVDLALKITDGALYVAHQRKFHDALQLFEVSLGTLKSLDEPPQVRLMLVCIGYATLLCRQFKHVEAEDHVSNSATCFGDFFGLQSPEYSYSLWQLGYILLHRGQLERAIIVLKVAYDGMLERAGTKRRDIILVRQYIGLCHLCMGDTVEAKAVLESIYQQAKSLWGASHPTSRLTSRCLGTISVLAGNWDEALVRLRAGVKPSTEVDTASVFQDEDPIGNVIGQWSLAWVLHHQGEMSTAAQLFTEVQKALRLRFGNDHKLTIASTHDLLWTNRDKHDTASQFAKLLEVSTEVLSGEHHLTRKISRSAKLCGLEPSAHHPPPKQVWGLGEAVDRPPQISDVDWLTWHWGDDSVQEKFARTVQRVGSNLQPPGQAAVPLTERAASQTSTDNSQPRPARHLVFTTFQMFSDLFVKLIVEFPRDFSPAFIEAHYSHRDEAPYAAQGNLGRGGQSFRQVEKVWRSDTDQVFARKYLRYTKSAEVRAKVREEVNVMRKLSHPHIVRLCCSYVVASEGLYALLMQPVADSDLTVYLDSCSNKKYPDLMLEKLPGWFACLANALHYLQTRQVKHRDIKPSNILVKGDAIYLTDFGFAKDWTASNTSITRGPSIGYTARYRAPEVANWDEDDNKRTRAVDIFSLGCVFAEIVTVLGRRSVAEFEIYRRDACEEDDFYLCLGGPMDTWFGETGAYSSFVREMMAEDASGRISTDELIRRLEAGDSGGYGSLVCRHKPSKTDME
jgi:hypothetical protein